MRCSVCQTTVGEGQLHCPICGAKTKTLDGQGLAGAPRAVDIDGGRQVPSERKLLTILSADIVASTQIIADLDPEDALERLAPALVAMRAAVQEHGGIVSEELGDGLLALFGAPTATEDHAVQACLAALTILHNMKALGDPTLQVRVGLHSGYAVTRFKQADLTRVYGASGPAVHLVSRLQSAALPGTILASGSCRDLAAGHIEMRVKPDVRLRDFADRIGVHEVIGVTSLSHACLVLEKEAQTLVFICTLNFVQNSPGFF
jgi:class 3 adenylate cyclase